MHSNKYIKEIETNQNEVKKRIEAAHAKFPDIQRQTWEERVNSRLSADRSKPYQSFDLSSQDAPFKITFIIGTNRTGSTLTNGLLAGSKDTYPALPDMHPLAELLSAYAKLLFRFDDDHFNHYGSQQRLAEIFKRAMHDTVMSSFFNAGFKIGEKKNLVLKAANEFSLHIDRLPELFGNNFKLVYILRDPRAIISSNKKYREKTGKGNLIQELVPSIKEYFDTIHATDIFKDKSKFFTLKYEDIVNKDERTFLDLENFLGFDVSRDGFRDMAYQVNEKLPQYSDGWGKEIHLNSIHKYKESLTQDEIECIEYFFEKYIQLYDY